ncbi:MAG: tetratricopeptide repeat protein [Chitinispirillia bacterium]|nr:tetratricopeptide repeat protein [Chitinispirillia bacterium]MCL2242025.1 tetratricopeptide repeat protein [Chitinispirillia bacterium]
MNRQYGMIIRQAVRLGGLITAAAALMALTGCVASSSSIPPAADTREAVIADSAAAARLRLDLEGRFEQDDRYRLAQDHFVVARDYERRGMYEMAEQLYQIAYDFWPESQFLRKYLLDRYMRAEEYQKALALFPDSNNFDNLTSEEKRSISIIYLRLGEPVKAAAAVEALGDDKTDDEMYSLSLLYGSVGDQANELKSFRDFFARRPNAAAMGIRLVRYNVGERKLADADSLGAVLRQIYPDNAEVAALMGMVKHLLRDTSAAVKLFNEALALDPLNEEALRTLAHIHVLRDEYREAAVYYRRLIAQGELGVPYRRGLALILFYMKEYAEAEKLLNEMIDERDNSLPGPQELYMYRAMLYSATGKHKKAVDDLRSAVKIDSTDHSVWLELGNNLEKLKRRDEAAWAFKKVLQIRPSEHVAANNLGYMWTEMGIKLDSAKTLIEFALEKDPKNGAYLDSYAWVFYKMGDYEKALHYMNEAEKHDGMKDEAVTYEHLGDIHFKLNDYAAAEKAYNRAIELKTEDAARIKKLLEEIKQLMRKKKGP